MGTAIEKTYSELLRNLETLESEVDTIRLQLRESSDRTALMHEFREKGNTIREIEIYLSSAFGRFSPELFGQEVSWLWMDLAAVAGVDDLLGVYLRQYNEHTPNSSMFFVNIT